MRKAIEITEWCGYCGTETDFGYNEESEIKGIEKCPHCEQSLILCSACTELSCAGCKNGSKFELWEEK